MKNSVSLNYFFEVYKISEIQTDIKYLAGDLVVISGFVLLILNNK